MKTIFKTFVLAFFTVSNLVFAEDIPIPDGNDGGGTHGPGRVAENPIDMYLVWLGVVAIITIFYIVRKNRKQLA